MVKRKSKHITTKNGAANPVAIQAYLKGVSYPARKQDILDRAHENDAPQDIIDAIEAAPEREYSTPAELTKGIGAVSAA